MKSTSGYSHPIERSKSLVLGINGLHEWATFVYFSNPAKDFSTGWKENQNKLKFK